MAKDRRADAVLFGFDFQVNAAIVLMLENITELRSLRLESENEDIDIEKEGKDILIGFNPRFLKDALRVIDDETVDIFLVNPKAPCFNRDDKETYTYLILPVNFTA